MNQAKRIKELEAENVILKRLVHLTTKINVNLMEVMENE